MMSPHRVTIDGHSIRTPRLVLRPWSPSDAPEALAVYGLSLIHI